MKIAIILGTRPEIIKMAPIIKELERRRSNYFVLHTGQHYSYQMAQKFFEDLALKKPKYNLNVGGYEHRKQVGLMVREITKVLKKEKPDLALVQGDTNTVLAGALASSKLGIKLGHHEAGLRSHNLNMLEENNRIITDHISDYLFAPTKDAFKNLRQEWINDNKIFLTGNTIVDAIYQNLKLAKKKVNILRKLNLKKKNYILATAHRAENVDDKGRLMGILEGLELVREYLKLLIVYPMHPRTKNNIKKFSLKVPRELRVIQPLGYLEFLRLGANAKLIITDSGGLQEEACILRVPCVTIRDETERPETIKAKLNILGGTNPQGILQSTKKILRGQKKWVNPFGDGLAAQRIVEVLLSSTRLKNA